MLDGGNSVLLLEISFSVVAVQPTFTSESLPGNSVDYSVSCDCLQQNNADYYMKKV